MSFYNFGRVVTTAFVHLIYRFRVEGLENIPDNRGFILCSNHISDLDPILVAIRVRPQCYFMAKEELFHIPVLAAIVKALGAFPVARGKGDTAAIQHAIQVVNSGHVLAIFPEGTRTKDGKLLKLKSGALVVASKTGGDILPCVIKKGRRKFLRRTVTVKYGKVIPNETLGLSGTSPSELKQANKLLTATLTGMLEEIHD